MERECFAHTTEIRTTSTTQEPIRQEKCLIRFIQGLFIQPHESDEETLTLTTPRMMIHFEWTCTFRTTRKTLRIGIHECTGGLVEEAHELVPRQQILQIRHAECGGKIIESSIRQ